MGKKQIKIQVYNLNATKEEVLNSLGIILDTICISAVTEENLFTGEYYLDAEFILDSEGVWENIVEEATIKVRLDYGEELFSIAKVNKKGNRITIFARQITIQESLSLWLDDVRPQNKDGLTAITYLLDNSIGIKNITVSSNITTINTAYYQKINLYNALHSCDQSFLNRWGGEIQRRGYDLKIDKKIGENRGVQIRSRKNLTGFEGNTNVDTLITRIKPVGADGIEADYVDSEYINNYKYIKTEKLEYKDVKIKDSDSENSEGFDTLEEAQAELTRLAKLEYSNNKVDILQAEYDINFVDLSQTEEYKEYIQVERVYLGDEIQVIEDKYNINITVRAIKRYYDVLKQRVKEITLSTKDAYNKPPTINQIKNELEQKIEENKTYYEKALENVNSLINQGFKDSYVVVRPNEILIMDSTDINTAINVWRWNKAGLGFSSTGYNGTYETAITMDGNIVAKFLTGLMVKGDQIDARNLVVGDTISISSEGFISIVQGFINIDKEGIKINLVDSENNILGYVLYDGQGVQIFDTEGNDPIAYFTREGSYIENCEIDKISCYPLVQVATRNGCSRTWYVSETQTGDGSGRDENNKACSIMTVLKNIKQYGIFCLDRIDIYIQSGYIKESIVIQDFYGTMIKFHIAKGVVIEVDKFTIEDCSARIWLEGDTNEVLATDEEITSEEINSRALIKTNISKLFNINNCNYINISGLVLRGIGNGYVAEVFNASKVIIKDCDFSNFDSVFYTDDLSQTVLGVSRGNVKNLSYISWGGLFTSTSQIPKYSDENMTDLRGSGIHHTQPSYIQYDTLYQAKGTENVSSNKEASFELTNLYTTVEGDGKATTARKGYVGQGKYQSYKAHRGHATIPTSDILEAMEAKINPVLKLVLTRLNTSHGYNSETPHPIIRTKGTSTGATTSYWDTNTKFARGAEKTIILDDSIVNGIKNGATELEFWANSNQNSQYSFYNNLRIIVEGENTITEDPIDMTAVVFSGADELVEVAMTYWRHCDDEYDGTDWSQGLTYRASNTPMSGKCESTQDTEYSLWVNCNGNHYKAIDCSTLANSSLKGYSYEDGPYSSKEAFEAFRKNRLQKNDNKAWSLNAIKEDGTLAREAASIAEFFYNQGWIIPLEKIGDESDNYSGLNVADFVFMAKKNPDGTWKRPDRFMKISHVAIVKGVGSDGNKQFIESTNNTVKKHTVGSKEYNAGVIIRAIKNASPETIVLVGRIKG